MYQNVMYTEVLVNRAGIDWNNLSSVSYRGRSDTGSPANFLFRAASDSAKGRPIPYHGLPYFLGRHAYFRLNACNYCTDVFAEAADACFADAWLPEYASEPAGTSIVVVRSSQLNELLAAGADTGELRLEAIVPDRVAASQSGQVRRKLKLVEMRCENRLEPRIVQPAATVFEKADWWLQRRTQKRSKTAWATVGRKLGLLPFWIAMSDLVLSQLLLEWIRDHAYPFVLRMRARL